MQEGFPIKFSSIVSLERNKARLVANDFTQMRSDIGYAVHVACQCKEHFEVGFEILCILKWHLEKDPSLRREIRET